MNNIDKIAVLMATCNGEKYLRKQLESKLKQSYNNFTIFIHDDGSKDNTISIINDYSNNNQNKIVLLEYEPLKDPAKNFLSLLSRVDADNYMFCDQDDYWLEDKVKTTYEKIKSIERKKNKKTPAAVFVIRS